MNVLGAEPVLVSILDEPLARVNHEDTVSDVCVLFVNHQNTSGDSGYRRTGLRADR